MDVWQVVRDYALIHVHLVLVAMVVAVADGVIMVVSRVVTDVADVVDAVVVAERVVIVAVVAVILHAEAVEADAMFVRQQWDKGVRMKDKLIVNLEVIDLLEQLMFKVDSERNIIAFMLSQNYDIESKAFKDYQQKYEKNCIKYNTAKEEINKAVLIKAKDKKYKWHVDFDERCVIYEC